jgi:hypothetical protein
MACRRIDLVCYEHSRQLTRIPQYSAMNSDGQWVSNRLLLFLASNKRIVFRRNTILVLYIPFLTGDRFNETWKYLDRTGVWLLSFQTGTFDWNLTYVIGFQELKSLMDIRWRVLKFMFLQCIQQSQWIETWLLFPSSCFSTDLGVAGRFWRVLTLVYNSHWVSGRCPSSGVSGN